MVAVTGYQRNGAPGPLLAVLRPNLSLHSFSARRLLLTDKRGDWNLGAYENSAGLYSRTYSKRLNPASTDTFISTTVGASYTDIKITATLGYNEPSDAELFDTATNNAGNYVFDEIGLFTFPTDGSDIDTSTMLTHVIFHPVQKSQNRIIEIVYTVRIQLS